MKNASEVIEQLGDINDILDNIQVLKKLIKAIDGYNEIQKYYEDNKISDEAFIKKYCSFYQLRFVSDGFKSTYFAIMQRLRDGEALTFKQIAEELYSVDGKHQLSLISKLMHTADTDLPVYDSLVAETLATDPLTPDAGIEQKIAESEVILSGISALYAELKENADFAAAVAEFDGKLPNKISFVKKCDLIMWSQGAAKKKNKE
ncbi:MAG: hypothetical protein LUD27_02600 [Clostridia bacterium]|nr:hypothetical protein [Clostridia bacterium]